jgi:nitrite reductase (cytochrome c-552)
MSTPQGTNSEPSTLPRFLVFAVLITFFVTVLLSFGVAWLMTNIIERQQEAKDPYLKLVNVTEDDADSSKWGMNFPSQYNAYLRTAERSKTSYGGGGSEALPDSKLDRDPWLKRLFAGYAFSLDYRDRRGHAYMLIDQEMTERVKQRPQPGACLHCHSSVMPLYRFAGNGDVMKGFAEVCKMSYQEAREMKDADGKPLVQHPVGCVDCHDPNTMQLRITRPAFINGIKALKESRGIAGYDVNRDASRQELRSFVCAQCHVEYYFKGADKLLTYPWANGLKIEEIEKYYDDLNFTDWTHAETGAPILKAQHPEFELWNQGIHARSGVACADCHMPFKREGAMKISDHWVRSPLLNVNRACQQCHHYAEDEIQMRVKTIQDRTYDLMQRAAKALTDMLDAVKAAKQAGAGEEALKPALLLQRKGQWRLDFIVAENSMGFHAPQEAARILGEAIDYFRQAQLAAQAAVTKPAP